MTTGSVRPMFDVYAASRPVRSDGVTINVTEHGPPDGETVLLLHGFPDSARLWRNQIPVLAEAGYRVLAHDLRGFGKSDIEVSVPQCGMGSMCGDALAVLDDAGVETAHVVGHDWGAAVAWALALGAPDRVRSLTALSVGHPSAFQAAGLTQREKSWYMLFFQFEGVAERWLSADDWSGLRRWSGSEEAEHWISDLSRPGALEAALNIYRANSRPETFLAPPREYPPLRMPVMGVWSSKDRALTERQMLDSAQMVAGPWRYERIEEVGHWIPVEAPDRLNALLLDWLAQQPR